MKYWILFLIGFSLCANTYDEVFISGNSDNRLDIVFAQPENENPNLVQDVLKMWNDACDYYPFYKRYKNFFNIHVISRNDFLVNESWYKNHVNTNNFKLVDANFSKRDLGFMMRFPLSNNGWATDSYLEQGRLGAMMGTNFKIFAHEMGHMLGDLYDTYLNYIDYHGYYPQNIILPDTHGLFIDHEHFVPRLKPGFNKWSRWQDYEDPITGIKIDGPFMEHTEPHSSEDIFNYWRTTSDPTLMRSWNAERAFLCPVEREHMVLSLHKYIDPLDSYSDNNLSINDFDVLEANVVDKDVIDVLWSVNGEPISNQHFLAIKDLNLTQDTNITLTAWDNTLNHDYETDNRHGWVRTDDFLTTYSTGPEGVISERDESNKLTQIIDYNYVKNSEIKKWYNLIPNVVGNWKQSNWFGVFGVFQNDWIYHEKLAWIYVHQAEQGLWLYLEGAGWHWTNTTSYPYLYSHTKSEWVWVY